jgi:hypothetical protein
MVQTLADAAADGEDAVAGYNDTVDDLKITTKENVEVGKVACRKRRTATSSTPTSTARTGRCQRRTSSYNPQRLRIPSRCTSRRGPVTCRDEIPGDATAGATPEAVPAEGKPEQAVPKIVEGCANADRGPGAARAEDDSGREATCRKAIGAKVVRFVQVVIGA